MLKSSFFAKTDGGMRSATRWRTCQFDWRDSRSGSATAYNTQTCYGERGFVDQSPSHHFEIINTMSQFSSSRGALRDPASLATAAMTPNHTRIRMAIAILAIFAFLGGPPSLSAADNSSGDASLDWPLSRGDAESSGAILATLPDDLTLLWEFQADEAIETTPVVADGRVFVADVMGQIYAVNFDDGKEIWRHDYDTGFVASPSVSKISSDKDSTGGVGAQASDSQTTASSMVVIGDVEGNLYALDAATGKEIWKQTTGGEINGSAGFYKDKVLVTSQDGKLYAFAITDGSLLWTYETDDQIRCSPTIAGSQTFLGGCDGRLHRVDLDTGKVVGEPMSLGGPTGSTPAVSGDFAYVPIMDGAVLAFDWKAGTERWRYEDPERPQEYRGSAAVTDSLVIVSSRNKFVDAISTESGQQVWRHTLRRRADASPVVAGDNVWVASTDGRLIRLDKATGEETWQYEIRGGFIASPAIAQHRLVVADDNGVVRAFGRAK